ncbi:16127_t:CDS:2 [Cetraspora pellucida]|uniref:16127_t:CDS:1 n=1 Tax=Cetraspora pellucida TaxID=1433469 RepID=A0A9N9ARY9_9GLOM|nr:16127_t:CDS:2 [Cetraspora pellucida]
MSNEPLSEGELTKKYLKRAELLKALGINILKGHPNSLASNITILKLENCHKCNEEILLNPPKAFITLVYNEGTASTEVQDVDMSEAVEDEGEETSNLMGVVSKLSIDGEEIRCWYLFAKKFEERVKEIKNDNSRYNDQQARGLIYGEVTTNLPGFTRDSLRKKTAKARNIYKLFGESYDPDTKKIVKGIGIEKIERIRTYKTSESIPYAKYFDFFPCEKWALDHYVALITDNYKFAEKKEAHRTFYITLHKINDDLCMPQEVRDIAQNLIENSKQSKEDVATTDAPTKKQCVVPETSWFCPDMNVPLQANGGVNTLEIIKSAVRVFDQKTIALGSTRSYKCSNHLQVESKCDECVPRESVYDAEMYRILHNWLAKVHGFEITGQWHLKGIGSDGDWHHLFCDLTIKKPDNPYPEAVLEAVATGSISTLKKHFDRVIKEDSVVSDPYWPSEKLQDRGLNVIHFWHDEGFEDIRMSARFRDATGKFCEIIDEPILL